MTAVIVPLDTESDLWLDRYCKKYQVLQCEAVLTFFDKNAPDLLPTPGED